MHKCLKGTGEEDEDRPGEWTRGNKHKLKHTEGSIEVEGEGTTVRATVQEHRTPKNAVGYPFLRILRSCLDVVLGNLL